MLWFRTTVETQIICQMWKKAQFQTALPGFFFPLLPLKIGKNMNIINAFVSRIIELCHQFPHGITDQVIQNEMPHIEAQQRAVAINRLLSMVRWIQIVNVISYMLWLLLFFCYIVMKSFLKMCWVVTDKTPNQKTIQTTSIGKKRNTYAFYKTNKNVL